MDSTTGSIRTTVSDPAAYTRIGQDNCIEHGAEKCGAEDHDVMAVSSSPSSSAKSCAAWAVSRATAPKARPAVKAAMKPFPPIADAAE